MGKIFTKNNATRSGIRDSWNAYLLEGAEWTEQENPIVRSTATTPPTEVVSYRTAKDIDKIKRKIEPDYKIDAYIHFYLDDNQFDCKTNGLWAKPEEFFRIASHFAGVIGPDFSIYADFPKPLRNFQIYRMRLFEFACNNRGIPVIVNARWGSPETWESTIDEFPKNSMLAIGVVGSRLKYLENKYCFEAGFKYLLNTKTPHTLIVIGSANYPCFKEAKAQGVQVIQFDGDTYKYFKQQREVNK
jgi:hypothetical protein